MLLVVLEVVLGVVLLYSDVSQVYEEFVKVFGIETELLCAEPGETFFIYKGLQWIHGSAQNIDPQVEFVAV